MTSFADMGEGLDYKIAAADVIQSDVAQPVTDYLEFRFLYRVIQ